MRLYFVRHGQSEANVLRVISNRDLPHGLTELGMQQAAALAQSLASVSINKIYASPVLRAIQTAAMVSAALHVPYESAEALREFDCGVAEGRSDEAAWAMWRHVVDDWCERRFFESRLEGGESFLDIKARFVPFVDRLVQAHRASADNLVLLGHGGIFLCMLPLVLTNLDFASAWKRGLPNTGAIVAEPRPEGLVCISWCGTPIAG